MLGKVTMGPTTFRPTDSWRWYFDNEHDCLMLEINHDISFRSCYPSKMFTPDVFCEFPFTVSNAASYYQFYDSCQPLNLTEAQKSELAINAIIAAHFIKPQMPKSWYFIPQDSFYMPNIADIVTVTLQTSGEILNLLVVEVGENASLCLVVDPPVKTAHKTFHFAEVIKVMNNRLSERHHMIQEGNAHMVS